MYKFQKVNLSYNKVSIDYDWLLVIESLDDLIAYHNKTMEAQVPAAWENLIKTEEGKAHINTNLGRLLNFEAMRHNGKKGLIELTGIVSGEIFKTKAHYLLKNGKIYINKNGGFFPHSKNITVLEETFIDDGRLVFPQYSKSDIRIKQWDGGTHYYAYVGDFQVEDRDGNKKWNTEEEALKKAEYYLYRINREQHKIKV